VPETVEKNIIVLPFFLTITYPKYAESGETITITIYARTYDIYYVYNSRIMFYYNPSNLTEAKTGFIALDELVDEDWSIRRVYKMKVSGSGKMIITFSVAYSYGMYVFIDSKTIYATEIGSKDHVDWQEKYNILKNKYESLSAKYSSISVEFNILQDKYNILNSTYNNLLRKYAKLESDYDVMKEKYNKLKEEYDKLMSQIIVKDLLFYASIVMIIISSIALFLTFLKRTKKKNVGNIRNNSRK